MTEADRAFLRALIETRLAEAEAARHAAAGNTATVALDQQSVGRLSRMDALQAQAMARATEARRATEIARLRAARARLDAPDYGICATCGEAIPLARLGIDPALTRCADCTRGA